MGILDKGSTDSCYCMVLTPSAQGPKTSLRMIMFCHVTSTFFISAVELNVQDKQPFTLKPKVMLDLLISPFLVVTI